MAQQTTLSVEVAYDCPSSCQRLQSEKGTPQIRMTRVANSRYTPDLVCLSTTGAILSCLSCNQTQKSKLLICRYARDTQTLPLTVLTDCQVLNNVCLYSGSRCTALWLHSHQLNIRGYVLQLHTTPSFHIVSPLTPRGAVFLRQRGSELMSLCSFEIVSVRGREDV